MNSFRYWYDTLQKKIKFSIELMKIDHKVQFRIVIKFGDFSITFTIPLYNLSKNSWDVDPYIDLGTEAKFVI